LEGPHGKDGVCEHAIIEVADRDSDLHQDVSAPSLLLLDESISNKDWTDGRNLIRESNGMDRNELIVKCGGSVVTAGNFLTLGNNEFISDEIVAWFIKIKNVQVGNWIHNGGGNACCHGIIVSSYFVERLVQTVRTRTVEIFMGRQLEGFGRWVTRWAKALYGSLHDKEECPSVFALVKRHCIIFQVNIWRSHYFVVSASFKEETIVVYDSFSIVDETMQVSVTATKTFSIKLQIKCLEWSCYRISVMSLAFVNVTLMRRLWRVCNVFCILKRSSNSFNVNMP